jgi:hypothetical protein
VTADRHQQLSLWGGTRGFDVGSVIFGVRVSLRGLLEIENYGLSACIHVTWAQRKFAYASLRLMGAAGTTSGGGGGAAG